MIEQLRQHEKEGWIKSQKHPTLPLIIWNYTEQTQYADRWDVVTTLCRGLVTDTQGEIVAHPFRKFFNYSQLKAWNKVPQGNFKVLEKLDGSYIQVFTYNDELIVSSKGSFTSDQATMATDIIFQEGVADLFNPSYNYIFELIHPQNRIVLDYGKREELVLLGIIDKRGTEIEIDGSSFSMPKEFTKSEDISWEDFHKIIEDNQEGFVVKFDSGDRMKIKSDEYLRLHKIVTQTTSKDIWLALKENRDLRELIERVPDEFLNWVYQKIGELTVAYRTIERQVEKDYQYGVHIGKFAQGWDQDVYAVVSRKDTALYINTCMYPKLMFKLLDNNELSDQIWDMVRPPHEKAFSI